MYKAHLRRRLCDGFESETEQRADMAADRPEWDSAGGEVRWVNWAFETAFSDCDDAAEGGSSLKERNEVGDEAGAGVVT